MRQKYIRETASGTLLSTAQDLTGSWVQVGSDINCEGYNMITLWLDIDANNSLNIRFQVRVLRANGGDEYMLPIYSVESDRVKFQPQYYELDVDGTDTKIVERFNIADAKFVALYVQAGTVGATAGQIESVYYDLSTAVA